MRDPHGDAPTAIGKSAGNDRGTGFVRLSGALIVLAGLAAYHGAFSVPFVFDDLPAIIGNSSIHHWGSAFSPPTNGATVTGRPFLNLSFALNYALGGNAVWGYHAVNLAIHLLAGLTLFGIVRRTLERCESLAASATGRNTEGTLLAFAVALIWTVHPLQTESVTYVVQRAESLMGLFYLLTLYCFIRYAGGPSSLAERELRRGEYSSGASRGGIFGRSGFWFGLSWLACLLGMATKEVMVSAPVIVLLYDRTYVSGGFREAWRRHRKAYLALGSTWLLLIWLVLRAKNRGGTAGFGLGVSPIQYWLTQFPATLQYLKLSLWPSPLVFDYGTQWVQSSWSVLPSAILVGLLIIGTGVEVFRRPAGGAQVRLRQGFGGQALGFAGAWFFAILAPTSLMPGTRQTMAEHRMYLALVPVIVLAVWGLAALLRVASARWATGCLIVIVALIAAGFGRMTVLRNEVYRNDLALWGDTVPKVPENPYAHNNLGIALFQTGRISEAATEYKEALRWKPDYPNAHNNWGNILLQEGKYEDAIAEFQEAVRLDNGYSDAMNNWGSALGKMGRRDEAEAKFKEALQANPESPKAHSNYGKLLVQLHRLPEALEQYEKALQADPDDPESHFGEGNALAGSGRIPDAMAQYAEAVRLRPGYAEAHNNLGNMLAGSGRLPEALEQFQEGVRLEPGNAGFRGNLGKALAQSGRFDEAIAQFEEALKIDPNTPQAREILRQLQADRSAAR